jgi:hypothetical protein
MKPFADDSLNWDDMVAQFILGPEFAETWEALKGSGIGPIETSGRVVDLIKGSDWHLSRLKQQHATIMEACADIPNRWSSPSEIADRVMDELLIAATSYMVMGIMLGVALIVRRLAKEATEALEEEKPVVN